ncbi:hypothetical protein TVD_07050 [Thioalkalivibrio versutus]|uniref:Uncharacterized protein n=1 Tax=Thioalkalivibrio versutus TaxID=106634 RepID=A0A0G3G6P8_9GAMM|nr:hypothetical protein TVD_07050 [Thioalkalivibrio versutus]
MNARTFGMTTQRRNDHPPVIPETAQRLSGISVVGAGTSVGVFARVEIPALRSATAGMTGRGALRPG